LIFATFLRVRSASKVLRALNERGLSIPRRGRFGDTVWRSPTVPAILTVLKNPAYAGAFVYGRSGSVRTAPPARASPQDAPAWAVEGRRAGQVPRLCQLGDVREEPGHAARQSCGVQPEQ